MIHFGRFSFIIFRIRTVDALPGSRETGEIIQKTQETFVADLKSCKNSAETDVVFLESVQARLSVSLSNMASKKEVRIFLTSPAGKQAASAKSQGKLQKHCCLH